MTLVLGTGLAQIIVVATSPLLTRLYSPSDYGIFAVALAIVSVLITITCLRYENALPLPEDDLAAANVMGLSILINGVMSLAAGVILWFVAPWVFPRLGATALVPFVWVIPLAQFGGGLASIVTNWSVRTKMFSQIATMRITQAISLVVIQAGLGFTGAGPGGLLIGDAAGRVAGSSRVARVAWRTHGNIFRQMSLSGARAMASRYRRFPIYSTGSALLATFAAQFPVLIMVAVYGPAAGGIFALAARMAAVPLTLVANSVGQVFMAESAIIARNDPAALRPLFRRTTWNLGRAAIGPAAVVMLLAIPLTGVIFGAEWDQVGLIVAILVPSYYLEFVVGATGGVLFVLERQDLQLVREIARFSFLAGAVPLAALLGLSAIGAVVLLSVAGVLNYVIYGLISWRAMTVHERRRAATDD